VARARCGVAHLQVCDPPDSELDSRDGVMGIYNFQERFVPMILSGTKTHTIRSYRVNPDLPGNILHLYTSLRRKDAKLLMRVKCLKIQDIRIFECYDIQKNSCAKSVKVLIEGMMLSRDERESLAIHDGFSDFEEMIKFWKGRLPFDGQIIHWVSLPVSSRKL
jgi:hypothetical protein